MNREEEQYFETLIILVKKEIALYTKYAVRLREDGKIRHIYNTRLFKEELENILQDDFSSMDQRAYEAEREALFKEWNSFHEAAYDKMRTGIMLPVEYLLRRLRLTEFEAYCVCLAVAPELNREFERMYCHLQDDYNLRYPTLDLCVKMFTMDSTMQKTLILEAVRRKDVLACIFQGNQETFVSSLLWKLKLKNHLTDYFFFYESDLLKPNPLYELYVPGEEKEDGVNVNLEVYERIRQCVNQKDRDKKQAFILKGAKGSGRKRQVRLAAQDMGQTVLFVELGEIMRQKSEQLRKEMIQEAVLRAVLNRSYLCFSGWEALLNGDTWENPVIYELFQNAGLFFDIVYIITETDYQPEERLLGGYHTEQLDLLLPDISQRIRLWKQFLKDRGPDDKIPVEALAAQFDFTPGMMKDAVRAARRKADTAGQPGLSAALLYEACQQKISHRLGERAQRVNAFYTWDDLILEEEAKELLHQACAQISFRYLVYEEWGFQKKLSYGRGVSMLFAGPPGTGKTMAAQVLANELNLELYKVDLSGVLSKYIGETQKNLKEIFDEVQKSRSILFFDEADALFGKRVSVTDARDISANAQTAYLLQKMEEYDGITILATNLMQNFDDAYKRRMKYIIQFTLPKEDRRRSLWEKVFPKEMPLDTDIDIEYLAFNFELSGAAIKNIALNAAFLAAAKQETTGMEHIMTALQQEYQKAGKTLGKEELKEYYIYKR